MAATDGRPIRVLMFPWLGHGHISPFLELAKKLPNRNFYIYFCSTPINLDSIKKTIDSSNFPSIQLVELHLPSSPELPPHYHTTRGLQDHLKRSLIEVFGSARSRFLDILTTLKPDLLINDFLQPWAAEQALSLNIPTVQFMTFGAKHLSWRLNDIKNSGSEVFPLRSNYLDDQPADGKLTLRGFILCFVRSCDVMLVNSFREIEAKYLDEISALIAKKIVLVGSLVQDPSQEHENGEITEWLDKKERSSVVYISFGSENYLSKHERDEMAHGLVLSNVNFIWVLRFPHRVKIRPNEAFPNGFLEKVQERGLIVEDWGPQKRILGHPSIGGFVSHCGWNSVMESIKFGVPIIAMPIKLELDQPGNAKLAAEVGVSLEIKKGENGTVEREEVAKVIKQVVMEKSGENIRRKAKELRDCIRGKGETEMDVVVKELVQICRCGEQNR